MPQDPSLPRAHPKLLVRTRKAGATQTTSPARRALEAQRSQSVSKCQEYLAGWKAPIPSPASAGPRRRLDHDRAVDQRAPDEGEESGFEDGDEDEEGEDEDEEEGDDEDNEDEDDEDEELLDEYGHQAEDETNIHPELRTKKRRSDGETETETETVPSKKVKNAASGPAADAPRASVHPPSARSVLASLHDTNSPAVAALPSRTDRQPGFDEALPPSAMALLMQMCSKMDRMEQGFQRIGQVEQQLRDLKSEISGNVMNSTASATSTASSQSFTILGHADQTGQARQDEAKDSPKDYVKAESAEQYTAITGKTLASSEEMQWTKSHLRGSYAAHIGQDPLPSNKIIPLTFMMRHADGTKFTKAEVEVVTETAYALSQETEKWPDRRPISKSGKRIGNQNYRYFLKYHKAELTKLFIRLGNAHEALQYCDAERYKVKEFFMRRFKNACETSTKTEIKIEHEELALTINTARAHVKGKRTSKIIQMTSSSLDAEEAFSEDGADEGQVPGQRNRGRKPKTTAKAAKKPVPRSLDTITSDEEVTDKGEGDKDPAGRGKAKQVGRKGSKAKASDGPQPERPKARRKGGPPAATAPPPGVGAPHPAEVSPEGSAQGGAPPAPPRAQDAASLAAHDGALSGAQAPPRHAKGGAPPAAPAPYGQGHTGVTPTLAIANMIDDPGSAMARRRFLPAPHRPTSPSPATRHGYTFDQGGEWKEADNGTLATARGFREPLQGIQPVRHERLPTHYGQGFQNHQLYHSGYSNTPPPPPPFSSEQEAAAAARQSQLWANHHGSSGSQDHASYAGHSQRM